MYIKTCIPFTKNVSRSFQAIPKKVFFQYFCCAFFIKISQFPLLLNTFLIFLKINKNKRSTLSVSSINILNLFLWCLYVKSIESKLCFVGILKNILMTKQSNVYLYSLASNQFCFFLHNLLTY